LISLIKKTELIGFDISIKNFSPRSIEALKSLGIEMSLLYQISFKEFLNNNPDIRVMDCELQNKRYQHYESKRMEKINKAIERRKELITNPEMLITRVN